MMFILLISGRLRYIQLKDRPEYFITNLNNNLILQPPGVPDFSNQEIFIKNRILYFVKENAFYTIALAKNKLVLETVKKNFQSKISFAQVKKPADIFGFRKNFGDNKFFTMDDEEENKKMGFMESLRKKTKSLDENENKKMGFLESLKKNTKSLDDLDDQNNRHNRDNSGNRGEKEKNLKSEIKIENNEIPKKIEKPVEIVKKTKEKHFIESDSSMDEMGSNWIVKEVKIKELDEKYFQLTANDTLCVTYFRGEFILSACTNSDSQLFQLNYRNPSQNINQPPNINLENHIDISSDHFFNEENMNKKPVINLLPTNQPNIIDYRINKPLEFYKNIKFDNQNLPANFKINTFPVQSFNNSKKNEHKKSDNLNNELDAIEKLKEVINDKGLMSLL